MNTKVLVISKAEPIKDTRRYQDQSSAVVDVEIHIKKPIPREEYLSNYFDGEAHELAKTLADSLPGAVFDRLTIELLNIKASDLRIPYGDAK